jgi:hypothetical protein
MFSGSVNAIRLLQRLSDVWINCELKMTSMVLTCSWCLPFLIINNSTRPSVSSVVYNRVARKGVNPEGPTPPSPQYFWWRSPDMLWTSNIQASDPQLHQSKNQEFCQNQCLIRSLYLITLRHTQFFVRGKRSIIFISSLHHQHVWKVLRFPRILRTRVPNGYPGARSISKLHYKKSEHNYICPFD